MVISRRKIIVIIGVVFLLFWLYRLCVPQSEEQWKPEMIQDLRSNRDKFESVVEYNKSLLIKDSSLIAHYERTLLGYEYKKVVPGKGFQKAIVEDFQVDKNIRFILHDLGYREISVGAGGAELFSVAFYKIDGYPCILYMAPEGEKIHYMTYERIDGNWYYSNYDFHWREKR